MSSLGVGLTASRDLMRHFGGNVLLMPNQHGSGCTARVILPLNADILERDPDNSTSTDAIGTFINSGPRMEDEHGISLGPIY